MMKGTKKTKIRDPENEGSIKNNLSKNYPEREIVWEPSWIKGGQLGFVFPKKTDPVVIAKTMREIIEETSERI